MLRRSLTLSLPVSAHYRGEKRRRRSDSSFDQPWRHGTIPHSASHSSIASLLNAILSSQINEKAIEFNDKFLPHDGVPVHTTALIAAIQARHPTSVKLLLDNGAVLEPEALYVAVAKCDMRMVDLLLYAGADPDATAAGHSGSTLEYAQGMCRTSAQYAPIYDRSLDTLILSLELSTPWSLRTATTDPRMDCVLSGSNRHPTKRYPNINCGSMACDLWTRWASIYSRRQSSHPCPDS